MSDLRVPTTSLPVEIRCSDGRCLEGDIFMPAQSSRQPGPMRPDEWIDTVHVFFPLLSHESRRLTIVNRDAVVAVAVPATVNASDDDTVMDNPVLHVAIDVVGGHFEGDVLIDMPPDRRRVADWLSAPAPFITLRAGATHHLIQKRHVTRVVELTGGAE